MKKIISVMLSALMLLSVIVFPVFADEAPTDGEIKDIFRIMGVSTWGSGYFGCHMMNPSGDPATDSVVHQYIQSAGLLKEYEYEKEVTAEWGTYNEFGYELPYAKYIEIIDSVFANHSDMKSYLNNEWNHYYNEETGIVSWPTGGFGGPTTWLVDEIYRQSSELIYATGVMVDYGYDDIDFEGKKEHFEYINVSENDGNTYKGKICDAILLTLKSEDGKWKILEYRENMYHIDGDRLYDFTEENVFNRLTIEKNGVQVYEAEDSKDFSTGFYANGSKWYTEGQEITFNVIGRKGYKIKSVVLKDENGEKEITEKNGNYTIAPKGAAVLTVNVEKVPVDIEIAKPEGKEEIKVSAQKTELYSVVDKTVAELKNAISDETEILKADGTKAAEADKIASGMKLVIKDEDGEVIDTKTVVVPGDVDGDAAISANDARNTLRTAVGLDSLDGWAEDAADVDGGSNIDSSDARDILRAAVGLDDSSEWLSKLA